MRIRERFNPRAPCGARPLRPARLSLWISHFNPRAPCGARRKIFSTDRTEQAFQPTRPLRGATVFACTIALPKAISTHAPLAGRDGRAEDLPVDLDAFQPTRPLRGATPESRKDVQQI